MRVSVIAVALCAAAVGSGCPRGSHHAAPPAPAPPPPLAVTGLVPTFGPTTGGTAVTITGTGFQAGCQVRVGGAAAGSIVLSPTAMRIGTPAGTAGPADVAVTNAAGTTATAVGAFMYGTPAPAVTAVNPSSGGVAGGTLITVTGSGFQRTPTTQAQVQIGGVACTAVQVRTAAELTALTPAGNSAAAFPVLVQNPDTQSGTLAAGFTYTVDTTPPSFAGAALARAASAHAIEVTWSPATDNSTTTALIRYAIYPAPSSGTQSYSTPAFVTAGGATRATVGGLGAATTWWFVVRARDMDGIEDTNTVQVSATTLAAPGPSWAPTAGMGTARADPSVTVLTDGRVLAAGGRDATGSLASAELFDPITGTWTATGGALIGAREQHAAIVLPDGRVLVAGGYDSGATAALATAELYDPNTGTFTATGTTLITARQRPSLTLLASGLALAVGGLNGSGPVGTAEIYDPAADTWTATVGGLATARDWHGASLLASGEVLVAGGGGTGGFLSSAEVYNPSTSTFSTVGAMGTPRLAFGLTRLRDGRVVAAGGLTTGSTFTGACDIYLPAARTWSATGTLTTSRGLFTTVCLPDGRIHAAGGGNNSVEMYDPATGAWSSALGFATARDSHRAALLPAGRVLLVGGQNGSGPLASCELETTASGAWLASGGEATARARHTATTMPDGRVLVVGGRTGSTTAGWFPLAACAWYDPATDAWTPAPSLRTARWANTQALLPDGRVLVTGGTSTGTNVVGVEVFEPTIGTWNTASAPLTSRMNHAGTLLANGRVLICGGWDGTNMWSSTEVYDPASNTWLTSSGMAGWRGWHTATLCNDGRVLVAGGWSGFGALNTAERWDPTTGTWSSAGSFPQPRYGHSATLLADGRVLVAGGIDTAGTNQTAADLYDPATNTWTAAAALPAATAGHTATLLPSGRVILAGGFVQPQVYEPLGNVWTPEPNLGTARFTHTAALLADGRVLLAGGANGGAIANAERYDEGLGASEAWRPKITAVGTATAFPTDLAYGAALTITGTGLRGPLDGGTGGVANTAHEAPMVQFAGPLGTSTGYLDASANWRTVVLRSTFTANGTTLTVTTPASGAVPRGYYQLRVIANGISSAAVTVRFP